MRTLLPLLCGVIGACHAPPHVSSPPTRGHAITPSASRVEEDAPGPAPAKNVDGLGDVSVLGRALGVCSTSPMTGWFRDGRCRTDANDRGMHTVCAVMDARFLAYTKAQGNDLTSPTVSGFPGLRPGDRWCLCAARWEQARRAAVAPRVVLSATHRRALRVVRSESLREHRAADHP